MGSGFWTQLSSVLLFVGLCGLLIGVGAATTVAGGGFPTVEDGPEQRSITLSGTLSDDPPLSSHFENRTELSVERASFQPESGGYSAQTGSANVELTQELRRVTTRKGVYEGQNSYQLPEQLRRLDVTLPSEATVVSTSGFVETESARTYTWDGSTAEPAIRYRMQANRSLDQTGPIAGPGRLIYADVGEWGVVQQPQTSHAWGWVGTERVGLDRTTTVDGPGATGDIMAYLGEFDRYTRDAHGQTFELIVPDRAEMAVTPEALFDQLAASSDTLRVGDRDDRVFIIAAPARNVGIDWGVRGLQSGPADLWTRDLEQLATANNVWLHEYVHTRQGYTTQTDLQWTTEALATYYAALLTLEQDAITFRQFKSQLSVGTDEETFENAILSRPGTWVNNANYFVGETVAGELDRQLRVATDREHSFQEIFRQLNARTTPVSAQEFLDIVATAGGESVASEAARFTETTERPEMWTEQEHSNSFGDPLESARITLSLAQESETLRVTGAYRDSVLDGDRPVVLVPGEQLTVDVTATNFGELAGSYDAILRINEETGDSHSGELEPGAATTVSLSHSFEQIGEYTVTVGDIQLPVSVRQPAPGAVSGLSVNRSNVTPGDSITISVTASTDDPDRPAALTVPFTRNGAEFATEPVRLDVGAERTVSVTTRLGDPGTYVFGLGEASSETEIVTVEPPSAGDGNPDEDQSEAPAGDGDEPAGGETDGDVPSDDSGPGFGLGLGAVGLLGAAVLAVRIGRN